jgi:enoyl-CoA hydratase/carnithine racemase
MSTQSKERLAVDLEFTDGCQIAVITLVDTARDNAMSPEMGDAFRVVVDSLKTFSDLRCAIVRGTGKNFSIGGARDMLSSLADTRRTAEDRERFMLGFYDRWLTLLDIPVPVIAAIEGECIGVAPIFACASDVAIADDTAKFQITFTALGLFPGMAMAYLMPLCVGRQHAALAMLAGAAFSGREAAEWGLVARSVPPRTRSGRNDRDRPPDRSRRAGDHARPRPHLARQTRRAAACAGTRQPKPGGKLWLRRIPEAHRRLPARTL